ncbi:hypothetical protein OG453_42230 [Streptomyces sp. NBC_01381]|uniref:hypothetical protein n=1 Tax=Streptomyces sp. NBC_01381 TaxID=2903845 RepID=UPI00224F824A|nr:hypothetical protein [Streptomyces sp. NBC_01381]MCX4673180.1 hypothetical protein [Streptomyces sp. NBC_01381]
MPAPLRPEFHEGQVLAADDLSAVVRYERDAAARHHRHLHTWGIASGLEVTVRARAGSDVYKTVIVASGTLVDPSGREIVVPAPVELSTPDQGFVIADPDDDSPRPLLLMWSDQAATGGAAVFSGGCSSDGAAARTSEGFLLVVGAPGDELDLGEQQPPAPDAGPDRLSGGDRGRVLLSFVTWVGGQDGGFTAVLPRANGVGRRYAGVLADRVSARGGTLELAAECRPVAGKVGVRIGGADGSLDIGRFTAAGALAPALRVLGDGSTQIHGDVKVTGGLAVTGVVDSPLVSGSVLVQSGTATHGVILPLPDPVTADQVESGEMALHICVTPRLQTYGAPTEGGVEVSGFGALPVVLRCEVDSRRRLSCLIAWYGGFGPSRTLGGPTVLPGAVDYFVLATRPAD